MTRHFLLAALLLLLFTSCGNRSGKQAGNTADTLSGHFVPSSLVIKEDLGEVVERTYQGTLPCADCPGIVYTLTLWNQQHSGNGVYNLKMEYIDRDTFQSSGKWGTLRGNAKNPDATIYQLDPDSATYEQMNFLFQGDSLEMLGRNQKQIKSGLDYTLRLVKNK